MSSDANSGVSCTECVHHCKAVERCIGDKASRLQVYSAAQSKPDCKQHTVSSVFLAKYAALSRGFTLVPVIQGNAAVVTIATFLPGSLSVLSFFALFLLARLCSLCISHSVTKSCEAA